MSRGAEQVLGNAEQQYQSPEYMKCIDLRKFLSRTGHLLILGNVAVRLSSRFPTTKNNDEKCHKKLKIVLLQNVTHHIRKIVNDLVILNGK